MNSVACPAPASTRRITQPLFPFAVDPTKLVIAQTAPAIRVAIGELFGLVSDRCL